MVLTLPKDVRVMKRLCILLFAVTWIFAANAQEKVQKPSHFAWGAEIGVGIDMGGDDMSTFDVDAMFGYKNSWLKFAGVGAGIRMMMSDSSRYFPLYAMVRTSFSKRPKLLFAEMRGGIALNQAKGIPNRTNLFLQPGVGIELAIGRSFRSYLLLSYVYNSMTFQGDNVETLVHGLNCATISIGINF